MIITWRIRVKFISNLPRNHKMETITNVYHPVNSWTAWITRSYYGKGHVLTDNCITDVFDTGKSFTNKDKPKVNTIIRRGVF